MLTYNNWGVLACVCVCVCVCVLVTQSCPALRDPWTVACQTPLSIEFSRLKYWSSFSCPPPGDLPDLEIKPTSLKSPALSSRIFTTSATWEVHKVDSDMKNVTFREV